MNRRIMGSSVFDLLTIVPVYLFSWVFLILDGSNPTYEIDSIRLQLFILLGISFLLAALVLTIKVPAFRLILAVVDTIVAMLILILHHHGVGLRFWIASALLYRYSVGFNRSIVLSFSAAFYLCFLMNANRPIFGIALEEPMSADIWFLSASYIAIIILFQLKNSAQARMKYLLETSIRNEKSIDLLTDTNLGLQKYAISIGDESRLKERQKITRDLHDIVGYSLTSISMMLEYGEDLLRKDDKPGLSEILTTAGDQARNGLLEVRKALRQLRSIQEAEIPYFTQVKKIVDNFGLVTGIDISLEFGNVASSMSRTGEEFVYRFLQEGLTNSFRHGRATKIWIILMQESDNLVLSMEDNGAGSQEIVEGIGLKGMHERIIAQGGSLRYSSTPGGFTIIARLPLEKAKRDAHES